MILARNSVIRSLRCPSYVPRKAMAMPYRASARAVEEILAPKAEAVAAPPSGGIVKRFVYTAEVMVSKIFPAGFGWQAASVYAASLGYKATDMGFFVATGLGDFTGVFTGHMIYNAVKKTFFPSINLGVEAQTGFMLGSAAFCSGFIWQPAVNTLQAASLPFVNVAGLTWISCGLAFYIGLRASRTIYPALGMSAIEEPNYANLKTDAALSAAIGGATGAFVGTDVNYMGGDGNFLRPVVGIESGMSDLEGMVKAGTSTSLGFVAAQAVQNVTYPKGTNWTD